MRRAALPLAAIVAVCVFIGGAMLVRGGANDPDLCEPAAAFREWSKVTGTEPYSPERYEAAQPAADALVGCRHPLIGMTRTQVTAKLGLPDRGQATSAWVYDLGARQGQSIQPGMRIVFGADNRARSARIGGG